jgi:serine protease AprX
MRLGVRTTAALVPLGVIAAMLAPPGTVLAADRSPAVEVIVRYDNLSAAERAVTRVGGIIGRRTGSVHALTARVPRAAIGAVGASAGVAAVTPNAAVRLKGKNWMAEQGLNPMSLVARATGATDGWAKRDSTGRKITGAGVGVALIDSGVAPVKGLGAPGKVINGADLSFESQAANLRHLDTFGHGTHMAGIIAGRDPEVPAGKEADPKYFTGMAPDAHIVNVKVAAADGASDVSQVLAAIDWVVTHRNDPGMNIRVLNLSFGTDSTQDARLDPLSYAVEAAWRNGIVVVAAVGNDGRTTTRLSMPAANPYVIAVGAADPRGTDGTADDAVTDFSTGGNAARHADLFAAGRSIVSLRNPGSYLDTQYPAALVAGDTAARYFRGSGSSQSAAVVSGAAALLLQQRPGLSPDQVKRLLMASTRPLSTAGANVYAAGQLDVRRALDTATPAYRQTHPAALGTGTLQGARGSAHVADPDTGVELTGEQDIFGQPWTPQTWTVAAEAGTAWNGGVWNGTQWTGSDWSGTSWAANTWAGLAWSARTWSGAAWLARTWSAATWTGLVWTGRTWSGRTWSGRTWSGGYWS